MKHNDCFYREGFADYFDAISLADCPYPEGTDGQYGWMTGWQDAKIIDDETGKDKPDAANFTD